MKDLGFDRIKQAKGPGSLAPATQVEVDGVRNKVQTVKPGHTYLLVRDSGHQSHKWDIPATPSCTFLTTGEYYGTVWRGYKKFIQF